MKNAEELIKYIENMREKLIELSKADERILEIVEELNSFYVCEVNSKKNCINIHFSSGVIPIGGVFDTKEMLYAFVLMDFYCSLYYKCRKIVRRVRKKEFRLEIDSILLELGMLIKNQSLCVKPNKKIDIEQFSKEFEEFVNISIKALGHTVDQIGHLTSTFNEEEAKCLKKVRETYEKICFKGNVITYTDCISKKSKTISNSDAVEVQYMAMNVFVKAYTESILWLKKYDPSGQWCPITPWQTILRFSLLLQEHFLY